MTEFAMYQLLSPLFGFIMLGFVGYCFSKEGTHSRGYGWRTKAEAPKTFFINQTLYIIFSVFLILSPIVNSYMKVR